MNTPVINILVTRDGSAWRLYFVPYSWKPAHLFTGEGDSIHPVGRPDLRSLDRFAHRTRAALVKRVIGDGGVEIRARGRAALALAAWLDQLVAAARA